MTGERLPVAEAMARGNSTADGFRSRVLPGPHEVASLRRGAHVRTALAAVGENGPRLCTALPLIPDGSGLARRQARLRADELPKRAPARQRHDAIADRGARAVIPPRRSVRDRHRRRHGTQRGTAQRNISAGRSGGDGADIAAEAASRRRRINAMPDKVKSDYKIDDKGLFRALRDTRPRPADPGRPALAPRETGRAFARAAFGPGRLPAERAAA